MNLLRLPIQFAGTHNACTLNQSSGVFFSFIALKSTLWAETLFILLRWKIKGWDGQRKDTGKRFVFNYADELLGVS